MDSTKLKLLADICAKCSVHYDIESDGTLRLALEVYPRVVQQCLSAYEIAKLPLNVFSDMILMRIKLMEDAIRRG